MTRGEGGEEGSPELRCRGIARPLCTLPGSSAVGLPLSRVSLIRVVRPLADIAFHVYANLRIGPPAWTGFPVVYSTASSIARPPRILACILSSGLPPCRASHVHLIRPPADAALHVYVDLVSGPPASTGFPSLYCTASCIARPPCVLPRISAPGLPLCQASLLHLVRPLADIASHVYAHPRTGPPAWPGFPVLFSTVSGIARPPCSLPYILASGLPLCRASRTVVRAMSD